MSILYRIAPAILLFFFAPLVAEFVLGDLTFAQIGAVIVLAPLYGGGAILIREIMCRTGRGWPTFLFLAFAYALLEEALLTQSLFNPDYLHLRLIDYGFVPALSTAIPWAVFVLTIHIVWSLAVPTAVIEAAFPARQRIPWLKLPGLLIVGLLFTAGALLTLRFSLSQTEFRASPVQMFTSALLVLGSVTIAFFAFPRRDKPAADSSRRPVHPAIVGAAVLAAGSVFLLTNSLGRGHLPWPATASLEVAIVAVSLAVFAWAKNHAPWTAVHSWAAGMGGVLCYAWLGYMVDRSLHGPGDALAHSVFVAAALVIVAWTGSRAIGRRLAEN